MIRIFPSLIGAPLLELAAVIQMLDPFVDGYHIDIMDDHFVPNLTWGPMVANAIASVTCKQLWIHLMVMNPANFIDRLLLPANSILSFHFESSCNVQSMVTLISEKKWIAGIAINPNTAPEQIINYLPILNHVLIMSVNPGFSGQQFLPFVLNKATYLHQLKQRTQLSYDIGMDGGINEYTIADIVKSGVTDIAVASGIFGKDNYVHAIGYLRNCCQ